MLYDDLSSFPFSVDHSLEPYVECVSFLRSSPQIQALLTSASSGLEGFKAHAVFQEINKKLLEVRESLLGFTSFI